ncbi:MAG: O-antigen ligase family protein [Bryobacteraceae bacterium]|nr:O-antigen ligase family protein [Bryobacteraceae bacterium]MDW8379457.1 O-antigen ligase family protein [Bryobacterales bacterium]
MHRTQAQTAVGSSVTDLSRSCRRERWQAIAVSLTWMTAFLIPWGDMIQLPFEVQGSRLFSLITAFVWILVLWKRQKARRLDFAHWFLFLFVVWATLNVLWTPEAERGLRRAASYLQLFLVTWSVYQGCDRSGRYLALLQAYVFGCWVGVAGLLWNFSRQLYTGDGRYTAPGFDPNDLAVTLSLAIPMAWRLDLEPGPLRWINRFFVPVAVFGVLLTASRSGLVTLAICLGFTLTRLIRLTKRSIFRLAIVVGLTFALVNAMWSEISIRRLSTIFEQLSSRDMNGRVDIWQRGYAAFLESPLLGHGAGGFGAAVGTWRSRELAAHNAYLGLAVEHGLIGLVLFVSAFLAVLARARNSPPPEPQLWLCLLFAWAVAVTSLSWENRETTWLLLGIGAALPRRPRRPSWRVVFGTQPWGKAYA